MTYEQLLEVLTDILARSVDRQEASRIIREGLDQASLEFDTGVLADVDVDPAVFDQIVGTADLAIENPALAADQAEQQRLRGLPQEERQAEAQETSDRKSVV